MIPDTLYTRQITNIKFASWRRPRRRVTRYITVHYNGPPVGAYGYPNGELDQLRFDATYHMRPAVLNADGIQYNLAILSNGDVVKLRDFYDSLWHCGNAIGNTQSVAIHIPLGGSQQPTAATLAALRRVLDTIRASENIHVTNVRNHYEWKLTQCPGQALGTFVNDYRNAGYGRVVPFFRTMYNANVRAAASVRSAIQYEMPANTRVAVARTVDGVPYAGNRGYIELADGSGYIHTSIVQRV